MPTALLQPGVYIEEVPSGVRTITGVATSITLFLGWAPRGPTTRASRITSFAQYERLYGGLDPRTVLGHSVRQYFDNGGSDAYVVRLSTGDATSQVVLGGLTVDASSPGTWADVYAIRTTQRADDTTRFSVEVIDPDHQNAVLESFQNLSMVRTDPRFVESVINGNSAFITTSTPSPGPGAVPADNGPDGDPLAGGGDGTVLVPGTAGFQTALLDPAVFGLGSITDRIDLFNMVCIPGEFDPTTLSSIQGHCVERRAFLIVDPDENSDVTDMQSSANVPLGSGAANSAVFFPWVRAPDPLQRGALRSFPPSGFVAGVFARTDASRGVWKAPAGSEAAINGAAGLAITMSDAENGQLNPLGINCLRTLPIYGNVVWGSRTLFGQNDRGSEWKYVPVRRMALFLEESLYRGTQWVVFEPNDEPLWAQIRLNIGAFMQGLFRQGALQGTTPRQAYFVKCDRETTTQADINQGIVNIFVGFAPLKPAEFVVIRIQQMAGDIPT